MLVQAQMVNGIAQAMKYHVKYHVVSPSQQSEKWMVSVDLQLGTPEDVAELKHRKIGQEPLGQAYLFHAIVTRAITFLH